jgi:hypothetical protein
MKLRSSLHHECITGRSSDEATPDDSNLHQASCLCARPCSVCLSECLLDAGLLERGILRPNVK